ncbi:MAG: GNAT family N-acetyltransferase [Aquabacterium sp.]
MTSFESGSMPGQWLNPALDAGLLSRIEDASINASAPREQVWMDGWLVRTCPGKAKRARCINAVAPGRLPMAAKLERAREVFRQAGLPMVVRLTPFSQPPGLDELLADQGMSALDDTRVMVLRDPARLPAAGLPAGWTCREEVPAAYARTVGAWRGSPDDQVRAHVGRVTAAPVPHRALVLCDVSGQALCGGQYVREGDLVGLYDIFTAATQRGRGLARRLCQLLLQAAAKEGAQTAYLQVEADNAPARAVYAGLGFIDSYSYRYRAEGLDAH